MNPSLYRKTGSDPVSDAMAHIILGIPSQIAYDDPVNIRQPVIFGGSKILLPDERQV